MVRVRVPRHRVTLEASDNSVTCDKIVTWTRNCVKTLRRRMRRVFVILALVLSVSGALGLFLEAYDPPPPPPEPDQIATLVHAEVLPEDDTVSAIERTLEEALGLPRGKQIPEASSFERRVDEVAELVAVHVKEFQE